VVSREKATRYGGPVAEDGSGENPGGYDVRTGQQYRTGIWFWRISVAAQLAAARDERCSQQDPSKHEINYGVLERARAVG
jgi:hypothetical protein